MNNENPLQITIVKEFELEGVGLHTGNKSKISFRPAPANTGIRFFRSDLAGTPMIPARLDFVLTTVRGTNLGLGDAKVHTVEHVLSACTGLGIDNVDILVTANEPPIMDGSALPLSTRSSARPQDARRAQALAAPAARDRLHGQGRRTVSRDALR